MGTAPTVYRWDDADAPANPGSNANFYKSFLVGAVLKACLVEGYGQKPAAGWTLHSWQEPTSGQDGRLVVGNSSQTGVAYIDLNTSGDPVVSQLAGGWDDVNEQLIDPVPYNGESINVISDARFERWCVIANQYSCILLMWRDPETLSGNALSYYNMPVMLIGEVLPVNDNIAVHASPNFASGGIFRRDSTTWHFGAINPTGYASISRFTRGGSLNTSDSRNQASVFAIGAIDNYWLDGLGGIPLLPAYLYDGAIYGRWPGLFSAVGSVSTSQLLTIRDQDGLWTGDLDSSGGLDKVLIVSGLFFGYVSLAGEDWP